MPRNCHVFLAGLMLPALSAGDPIDTNRPGFSFTPGVVERGAVQFETGIGYTRQDSDSNTFSLPQAEIRFGVARAAEVFVSSLGWTRTEAGKDDNSGLVDPSVGMKYRVTDTALPTQFSLLAQISIPAGDSAFSSDDWDPSIGIVWSHAGRIPLAGTAKLSRTGDDYQFDNGLKVPVSLGGGQSVFVEWEANLPENGDSTHWLNGGYQLLRGDRMQFDLNAGIGLNDSAGDFRAGLGFSFRP